VTAWSRNDVLVAWDLLFTAAVVQLIPLAMLVEVCSG